MSKIYSIETAWERDQKDDTQDIEVTVFFTVTPGGGDGWHEPRYDAQAEFHHATHSAPASFDWLVSHWAEHWLHDNHDEAMAVYQDEAERERDDWADFRRTT